MSRSLNQEGLKEKAFVMSAQAFVAQQTYEFEEACPSEKERPFVKLPRAVSQVLSTLPEQACKCHADGKKRTSALYSVGCCGESTHLVSRGKIKALEWWLHQFQQRIMRVRLSSLALTTTVRCPS